MLPITNFVAGVQEVNPNKLVNEKKGALEQTKYTTFENRKPIESIIKHSKVAPQRIKEEAKKDNKLLEIPK